MTSGCFQRELYRAKVTCYSILWLLYPVKRAKMMSKSHTRAINPRTSVMTLRLAPCGNQMYVPK